MTTETTLPSTREELERKAVDLLVQVGHQYQTGVIDKRTASITNGVVWTLTAGLIDEQIVNMAAQQANEIGQAPMRKIFLHASKPALALAVLPGQAFALNKIDQVTGQRTQVSAKRLDPGELEARVAMLTQTLLDSGYFEA